MSYINAHVNISENQQQNWNTPLIQSVPWAFVSTTKICVEVMFLLWPIHKWTEWQKPFWMEKVSQ